MIEARVAQLERNAARSERPLDERSRGNLGAEAVTHPEELTDGIPDAVSGAFEHDVLRHGHELAEQASPVKLIEGRAVDGLFAPPLRMSETRQNHFAVEHDCRGRREHEGGHTV